MRLKFWFASLLLTTAGAHAQETVTTGDPDTVIVESSPAVHVPSKGMTKASVSREFGEPSTRRAAVGGASRQQPPITRWDYGDFSVFFEYDHVVDAVQRNNPAPIKVQSGLEQGSP
ncbi:MAG TPA: hypothetical protein VJM11_00840 [Nevskiaceae bacterium]|nr:hypothetical protein [Nevskiaceae bacterium]